MFSDSSVLSGEQIRAARALGRIDQSELARRSGLSLETIKRLERIRGPVDANVRTLRSIVDAFAAMGIDFGRTADGAVGVFLRRSGVAPRPSPRSPASVPNRETDCHRLIYHSASTLTDTNAFKQLLDELQAAGETRNAALDVTGVLFAQDGRFLSALEGPKDRVRQIYGAISCDPRHTALAVISDRPTTVRRFGDWTVCCGCFASDIGVIGDEPAFHDGFHPERLSPASALGLLCSMRELRSHPPRDALASRTPCLLVEHCLDRFCAPRRDAEPARPAIKA